MRLFRIASFVVAVVAACAASPAYAAGDPHALFARERAASGGNAWSGVAAEKTAGILLLGGAPSRFSQIIDRTTGFSKITTVIGPVTDVSGFDGVSWDFQGSSVSEQSLPGLVADAVTQAYVARDGWWNAADPATFSSLGADGPDDGARVTPARGSAIDVWFNRATGLIDRTAAHTDSGTVLTTEDDYRTIGALVVAFHSVETDPTGTVTVTNLTSFEAQRTIAANAVARPRARILGRIAGGAAKAVVSFRFNPSIGWVYTSVLINRKPAPVFFDSGASNYFVPAAAARLALRTSGGLPLSGVGNGSVNAGLASLGTMRLGTALLDDQHGVVAPLQYVFTHPAAGLDLDGLIGAEFLQNLRLTFDFAAKTMTFEPFATARPTPRGGVVLPILSDGAHAYVRATIDGATGLYLLDTGDAGGITVFRRFADAHGLFKGPGIAYLGAGGVGGHLSVKLYRAKSFTLAGATIVAPPVSVSYASAGSFASRSVAGNIGIRVISRYGVTFDFSRSTVTFVPTSRIRAPFLTDRTGMSVTQEKPDAFVVLSVVPGAPADQAGVHVGDRIVAFAGKNIATGKLGLSDATPYIRGQRPYTLTIAAKDGTSSTITIRPRVLLK